MVTAETEKNPVLPIRKFPSLVLPRNTIWLQHTIQIKVNYVSSGRSQEVKNEIKFQSLNSQSGRGRLQEVPNIVKRLVFWKTSR